MSTASKDRARLEPTASVERGASEDAGASVEPTASVEAGTGAEPRFAVLRAYFFGGINHPQTACRILEPIARLLRTDNPVATVDRLFKSEHVSDLRLICAVAYIVIIWGTLVSLLSGGMAADARWLQAHDHDNLRLAIGLVTDYFAAFLKLFVPMVVAFGGILTWAYQVGSARLGVVDLFACEIDTLCRMITVNDAVRRQTGRYQDGPPAEDACAGESVLSASQFNSQENYFPVFDGNVRDLQTLEARVVINITAFYTYMKAVRDSMRSLAATQPAAQERHPTAAGAVATGPWHESIRNVIYMLYLGLESARKAINQLVEFEPENAERKIVILISELAAYRFLCEQFSTPTEFHHVRLALRRPAYQQEIPDLCALVEAKVSELLKAVKTPEICEDLARWKEADELLNELNNRFRDAMNAASASPLAMR